MRPALLWAVAAGAIIGIAIYLALIAGEHLDVPETEHVQATSESTITRAMSSETAPTTLPESFGRLVVALRTPPTRPPAAARTAPAVSIATAGVSAADWDHIADCESGDWDRHGNIIPGTARWDDRRAGYEGGLHFSHATWIRAGGGRYALHAYDATREQQIEIADAWLARTSWAQWPVCSRKVGMR